MNSVTAVRDYGPVGQGASRPHRMLCDDDQEYIVKWNIPNWPRALTNEALGAGLAGTLELPVVPCAKVILRADLVAASAALQASGIAAGTYFGSRYLARAFDFGRGNGATLTADAFVNVDAFAGIHGFDTWVYNDDRNTGNVLLEPVGEGDGPSFRVHIIDNGFILTGPDWTAQKLTHHIDAARRPRPRPHVVKYIRTKAQLQAVAAQIAGVTADTLSAAQGTVPDEWKPGAGDRDAVNSFLLTRATNIERMLTDYPALNQVYPELEEDDA